MAFAPRAPRSSGRWPGTRELIIPRTPDILPYRVRGEIVEIVRVFHGARRWPEEPGE
jgi:toxin ParE1/3/4